MAIYKSEKDKQQTRRDFDKICIWLEEKGVSVNTAIDYADEIDSDEKIITINSKNNYKLQLHTLLHEAGHFLLRKNTKMWINNFPYANEEKIKTKNTGVDTIREEVLAWEKAVEIAKEFNIKLDKKLFQEHRQRYLWSYISHIYQSINYGKIGKI